jgi:hypothetical protein
LILPACWPCCRKNSWIRQGERKCGGVHIHSAFPSRQSRGYCMLLPSPPRYEKQFKARAIRDHCRRRVPWPGCRGISISLTQHCVLYHRASSLRIRHGEKWPQGHGCSETIQLQVKFCRSFGASVTPMMARNRWILTALLQTLSFFLGCFICTSESAP